MTTQARVYLGVAAAVLVVALVAWQWTLLVAWFDTLFGTNQGVS